MRFYYQDPSGAYVADYVTVNALLPGYNGSAAYARPRADGSSWLQIVEKGYAEWNETGREGRDGTNSYAGLWGGWMQTVDSQVLGGPAVYYAASVPAAEQTLIDALQGGAAVTVGSWTTNSQLQLVADHAYEVAGYNSTSATFELVNPWGFYEPVPLTWGQLSTYCGGFVVADASLPAATSSLTAGSQTVASGREIPAESLPAVFARQSMPDDAMAPNLVDQSHGDSAASDSLRKAARSDGRSGPCRVWPIVEGPMETHGTTHWWWPCTRRRRQWTATGLIASRSVSTGEALGR